MQKQVKAAVIEGPGKISIQHFPYPDLEQYQGSVLKVTQCGICGTDKHSYRGETRQNSGSDTEFNVAYPYIMGHEAVGILDAVSPGTIRKDFYGEELHPGDRITFGPDIVCGECYYCRTAPWYPWCEDPSRECFGNTMSITRKPSLFGANAEYMFIPPKAYLYKVPDELPDDLAVLTELMCVTYSLDEAKEMFAFDGEGFEFGGSVVVLGSGPLGLAHIIKARMLGASTIIATDISDYKLNLAKEFGADIVLNVRNTAAKERVQMVKEATHGLGANVVCECSGVPSVVPEGLQMTRKCGVFLEVGMYVDMGGIPVNMAEVTGKNIRIIGMNNHAATGYRPTMEMMLRHQNNFPWAKFISHKFKLDDYDEAIRISQTDESMKVVIEAW